MLRYLLPIAIFAASPMVQAQSQSDRAAIELLPTHFVEAWAKHDGHSLAQIMADDSDFITVGGAWFRGKKDFETYHTKLLSGRFHDAKMTVLEKRIKFIRHDLGFIRWSWTMEGDKEPDGTARPTRAGLMTMLAEKQGKTWKVIAAQNTNAGPGNAPELEGIFSPIRLPKAAQ